VITKGKPPVSRKTVGRLSLYRRILATLRESGTHNVYSHQLAQLAAVSPAQVRRDLMVIGYSGSPNRGYETDTCLAAIEDFLDGFTRQEAALVGVGECGRFLLSHVSNRLPLLRVSVGFDAAEALIGTSVDGCEVLDIETMEQVVREKNIRVAILALPQETAQPAAEALIRAGVRSIVDFSPIPLQVPPDVFVDRVDITSVVEAAAFFARESALAEDGSGPGGDPASNPAIEPVIQTIGSLLAGTNMSLEELADKIGARILTPGPAAGAEVNRIYAGDRVSDFLNEASSKTLPVTNLVNVQMMRVAELMEIPGVCFVEGVDPSQEIIDLAIANQTLVMVSPVGMFETCALIYQSLSGSS
jgi:redox-sensing transcriptional repressor